MQYLQTLQSLTDIFAACQGEFIYPVICQNAKPVEYWIGQLQSQAAFAIKHSLT